MSTKKSDETRDRILKSAWEQLESDEPHKSRMSDIARAAGISRQALYLHFPSRADLLVATARYLDEVYEVDRMLERSRAAKSAQDRLAAYIEAWLSYVPKIYGIARAFMAMQSTDEAAAAAWQDRMAAMRHGCEAAIDALDQEGILAANWDRKDAVDWLWSLLSVRNWEQLVQQCRWPAERYIKTVTTTAERMLLSEV